MEIKRNKFMSHLITKVSKGRNLVMKIFSFLYSFILKTLECANARPCCYFVLSFPSPYMCISFFMNIRCLLKLRLHKCENRSLFKDKLRLQG